MFDTTAANLRQCIDASRVTIRLHPERNLPIIAEARATDIASLRSETAIDQNAAATVSWVAEHLRTLVVEDAGSGELSPPRAMIDSYGLRAFVIAPIVIDGRLVGTLSVHENRDLRAWTPADLKAIEEGRRAIEEFLAGAPRESWPIS